MLVHVVIDIEIIDERVHEIYYRLEEIFENEDANEGKMKDMIKEVINTADYMNMVCKYKSRNAALLQDCLLKILELME